MLTSAGVEKRPQAYPAAEVVGDAPKRAVLKTRARSRPQDRRW